MMKNKDLRRRNNDRDWRRRDKKKRLISSKRCQGQGQGHQQVFGLRVLWFELLACEDGSRTPRHTINMYICGELAEEMRMQMLTRIT